MGIVSGALPDGPVHERRWPIIGWRIGAVLYYSTLSEESRVPVSWGEGFFYQRGGPGEGGGAGAGGGEGEEGRGVGGGARGEETG